MTLEDAVLQYWDGRVHSVFESGRSITRTSSSSSSSGSSSCNNCSRWSRGGSSSRCRNHVPWWGNDVVFVVGVVVDVRFNVVGYGRFNDGFFFFFLW